MRVQRGSSEKSTSNLDCHIAPKTHGNMQGFVGPKSIWEVEFQTFFLGGGFKHLLFLLRFGEDEPILTNIVQTG